MPPISGAICWADQILSGLDETLAVMKSIETPDSGSDASGRFNDLEDNDGESLSHGEDNLGNQEEDCRRRFDRPGGQSLEQSRKWREASHLYSAFRKQLSEYRQGQYELWCGRVSDILVQNLTRQATVKLDESF